MDEAAVLLRERPRAGGDGPGPAPAGLRDAATACAGLLDALARQGAEPALRGTLRDCMALCELAEDAVERGSPLAEAVLDACGLALVAALEAAPAAGPRGDACAEACSVALQGLGVGPRTQGDGPLATLLG